MVSKERISMRDMLAFVVALIMLSGCDAAGHDDGRSDFNFGPILENVALNVITETYADLDQRAGDLEQAVQAFAGDRSKVNLDAARAAWVATRAPWETSEGFLFGPVDAKGLDPALDSWPVNSVDLQAVLNGNNAITLDFVEGLANEQKGFHTIEFLLFGEDSNKPLNAFTDRELDYLAAASASLKRSTKTLADSWHPDAENFAGNLIRAGQSGSFYVSPKAAMQEYVAGLIVIADEVANGKIGVPYAAQNVFEVESRFSGNSINDFQNNIRSIRNVYTGSYGNTDGAGISDFVAALDAALDARFKEEVEAAIDAIGAIPGSFRDAILTNREAVSTAQDAVRTVQQTLEEAINPLLTDF